MLSQKDTRLINSVFSNFKKKVNSFWAPPFNFCSFLWLLPVCLSPLSWGKIQNKIKQIFGFCVGERNKCTKDIFFLNYWPETTQSCYTHCNATGGQCDSSFYRPGASFKALVTRISIGNVLSVWAVQQISHSVLLSWAGGLPFFFSCPV